MWVFGFPARGFEFDDDEDDVDSGSTVKANTEGEISSNLSTPNQLNDQSHSNSIRSSVAQVGRQDGGVGSDGHGKHE